MSRSPAPRAHVHRGQVEAAALWFDPALSGEAEARQRVLAAWSPGAEVLALEGGYLVRLTAPERLACAGAPGLPFTHEGGVLLAMPLSRAERERLGPPADSVVWVRAGAVHVHPLRTLRPVDVSAWLDVSDWTVVRGESLGAPPPAVRVLAPVEAPTRAAFGLGALAPEAEAMRARMEGRPLPDSALTPVRAGGWRERWRALGTALTAWWRGTQVSAPASGQGRALSASASTASTPGRGSALRERLRALASALTAWWTPAEVSRRPSPSPAAPSGPGVFSRLSQWLATTTPLGRLFGQRKAEYVRRLFELFESGQLDEALRYAIPLDKGAPSKDAQVALGLPGPRESLALRTGAGGEGGTRVFGGGPEIYAALRERYRAAFERLKREGRIEEAAFILAELLHEPEEAVSFLETHGRVKLAAELAEGRQLAPGLVVRQWVVAGDMARAMDVARLKGAFADALLRLGRTHAAEARALRSQWARLLAHAGDYARAVDVVWRLEEERALATDWLMRVVDAGGASAARALGRWVVLLPERFEEVRAHVHALWEADGAEAASARRVFVRELGGDKREGSLIALLLRQTVRVLLRDRAQGLVSLEARELTRLVELSGDTVLAADLPSLPPPASLPSASASSPAVLLARDFGADVGGPWPVHDVVPLPGGRVLVALGEMGARLLTRDGRCVAHFDVPAFSLVGACNGHRALALAPRGSLWRVSRLDLERLQAEPWCDLRADAFAPHFDGTLWFISEADTVMGLDTLADAPRALWRVTRLGGPVPWIDAGPDALSFVCVSGAASLEPVLERWHYELPGFTLRARRSLGALMPREGAHSLLALAAGGDVAVVTAEAPGVAWLATRALVGQESGVLFARDVLSGVVLAGPWVAVMDAPSQDAPGVRVRMASAPKGEELLRLHLGGEHPGARLRHGHGALWFFDRTGWLVRAEVARGEVHRLHPR
jgi:hypothetical protein